MATTTDSKKFENFWTESDSWHGGFDDLGNIFQDGEGVGGELGVHAVGTRSRQVSPLLGGLGQEAVREVPVTPDSLETMRDRFRSVSASPGGSKFATPPLVPRSPSVVGDRRSRSGVPITPRSLICHTPLPSVEQGRRDGRAQEEARSELVRSLEAKQDRRDSAVPRAGAGISSVAGLGAGGRNSAAALRDEPRRQGTPLPPSIGTGSATAGPAADVPPRTATPLLGGRQSVGGAGSGRIRGATPLVRSAASAAATFGGPDAGTAAFRGRSPSSIPPVVRGLRRPSSAAVVQVAAGRGSSQRLPIHDVGEMLGRLGPRDVANLGEAEVAMDSVVAPKELRLGVGGAEFLRAVVGDSAGRTVSAGSLVLFFPSSTWEGTVVLVAHQAVRVGDDLKVEVAVRTGGGEPLVLQGYAAGLTSSTDWADTGRRCSGGRGVRGIGGGGAKDSQFAGGIPPGGALSARWIGPSVGPPLPPIRPVRTLHRDGCATPSLRFPVSRVERRRSLRAIFRGAISLGDGSPDQRPSRPSYFARGGTRGWFGRRPGTGYPFGRPR